MDLEKCHVETSGDRIFDEEGLRRLQIIGDDSASFSVMTVDEPDALCVTYTVKMLQPVVFIDQPRDVTLIGLGGGLQARFIHQYMPELHLTAVEIDATIVDVARTHFGLPADDERLAVVVADGITFMSEYEACCDLILSDVFDKKIQTPALFLSREYFEDCQRVLRPGGIMTINMFRPPAHLGPDFLRMLEDIFAEVYFDFVEPEQGIMVLCKDPISPHRAASTERGLQLAQRVPLGLVDYVQNFPHAPIARASKNPD